MQVRLEVSLRPNRLEGGSLTLYDVLSGLQAMATIPCLGRASGGPPSTKVNGNTPLGDYDVIGAIPAGTNAQDLATYGIHARLALKGVQGEAHTREMVSADQLRIHGGHMKNGLLMATHGCIRVADVDMQSLLAFLNEHDVSFPFSMTVRESADPPALVTGEEANLLGGPT
jgi:hypothetical protein